MLYAVCGTWIDMVAITGFTSGIMSKIQNSGYFVSNTNHITAILAYPLYILSGIEDYLQTTGGNIPIHSPPIFGNFTVSSGLISGQELFYTIFFWSNR